MENIKNELWACWDDSEDKDTHYFLPRIDSQYLHAGKRESATTSCPLTSTHGFRHTHTQRSQNN